MSSRSSRTEKAGRESFAFATTLWTLVRQAQRKDSGAQVALAELCEQYYEPVEAFIRQRQGQGQAADLTQAFFAKFLQTNGIRRVENRATRFRSYLLGAVKHFLSDQWDYERAAKRGGGVPALSLEQSSDTSPGLDVADESEAAPDQSYDRQWAVTLLKRCLKRLREEAEAAGKVGQFDILKNWLPGASGMAQSEALETLGMSDGAFKVSVHRLRKRFRETVSAEIAQTVTNEEELRDELRYLIEVLS